MATENDNSDSDAPTVYVANSPRAWGKGAHETDALANLAGNYHGDIPETVDVTIVAATGFNGMNVTPLSSSVDADSVESEERFEIPRDEFKELADHVSETDILAEAALMAGETTEDN